MHAAQENYPGLRLKPLGQMVNKGADKQQTLPVV